MYYCLNLIHAGFLPAVFALIIWTLPGALGMYGFSIGVSHISSTLPRQAYALLSGLNAAVVGIIALAAVQLAQKAITDKMTRILVFLGACAGLLYNALWYFPLLMFLAGCASVIFDYRVLHPAVNWVKNLRHKKQPNEEQGMELPTISEPLNEEHPTPAPKHDASSTLSKRDGSPPTESAEAEPEGVQEPRIIPAARTLNISWQFGRR